MRKKIAAITEGISPSSRTIVQNVAFLLEEVGYEVEIVYIGLKEWTTSNVLEKVDKNDFSVLRNGKKICFDAAYIYSEGEKTKGWIQGYLSLLEIPFVSSEPLPAMLSANKFFCKNYLQSFGILTPKALKIRSTANLNCVNIVEQIGLPCMVKPNIGTDSYLIEKVHTFEQLKEAIQSVWRHGEEALIEEFIEGKDITCGVIEQNGEVLSTPLTEIIVPNDTFYSYEVKLQRRNKKQTPALLSNRMTECCQRISTHIFEILECRDYIRIDYMLKDEEFYFLEVNITPGISNRGNFPLQLQAMDISIGGLLKERLEECIQNALEGIKCKQLQQ